METAHHIEAGRKALATARWKEARRSFEAALELGPSADAYDGLAWAAEWLHDEQTVFAARERAYRMYLDTGDDRAGARMAIWLAIDSREFRGQPALTRGWLQRAHRLLDADGPSNEKGFLCFADGLLALMEENDTGAAIALARGLLIRPGWKRSPARCWGSGAVPSWRLCSASATGPGCSI